MSKKIFYTFGVSAFILALVFSGAFFIEAVEPPVYDVTIEIKDNEENPVEGAQIFLVGNEGLVGGSIETTDESGQVTFGGVGSGNYSYGVSKEGYGNEFGEIEELSGGITEEVTLLSAEHSIAFNVSYESGGNVEGAFIILFEGAVLPAEGEGVVVGVWITDENGDAVIRVTEDNSSYSYITDVSYTMVPGEEPIINVTEDVAVEVDNIPTLAEFILDLDEGHVFYNYFDISNPHDIEHVVSRQGHFEDIKKEGVSLKQGGMLLAGGDYTISQDRGEDVLKLNEGYLSHGDQLGSASAGDTLVLTIHYEGGVTQDLTIIAIDPKDIYVCDEEGDDTGDGSEGDPYKTISKALEEANPGDTIKINPGTYSNFNLLGKDAEALSGHNLITLDAMQEYSDEEGEWLNVVIEGDVGYEIGAEEKGPLGVTYEGGYQGNMEISGDLKISYGAVVRSLDIDGDLDGSESGTTALDNGSRGVVDIANTKVGEDLIIKGFQYYLYDVEAKNGYFADGVAFAQKVVVEEDFYGGVIYDLEIDSDGSQFVRNSSDGQNLNISFKVGKTEGDFVGGMEAGREITVVFADGVEIDQSLNELGDWTYGPSKFSSIEAGIISEEGHYQEGRHTITLTIDDDLNPGEEVTLSANGAITKTPNRVWLYNEVQRDYPSEYGPPFEFVMNAVDEVEIDIKALKWDGNSPVNPNNIYYNYPEEGKKTVRFELEAANELDLNDTDIEIIANFNHLGGGEEVVNNTNLITWDWNAGEEGRHYPIDVQIREGEGEDEIRGYVGEFIVVSINPIDMEYQLGGDTTDWKTEIGDFTAVEDLAFERLIGGEMQSKLTIHEAVNLTDLNAVWALQELGEHLAMAQDAVALNPAQEALAEFDRPATLVMTYFKHNPLVAASPSVEYITDSFGNGGHPVIVVREGEIVEDDKIDSFDYTDGVVTLGVKEWSKYKLVDLVKVDDADGTVEIDGSNPYNEVNFQDNATDPRVDFGETTPANGKNEKSVPQTTINANNIIVDIPASTVSGVGWDGKMDAPTATTTTLPVVQGKTRTLSSAIQLGFPAAKLSFTEAVRILIPGEAGKKIGYTREGEGFTEI